MLFDSFCDMINHELEDTTFDFSNDKGEDTYIARSNIATISLENNPDTSEGWNIEIPSNALYPDGVIFSGRSFNFILGVYSVFNLT